MYRIIESHNFGPHEVVVVENVEEDDTTYLVLVDNVPVMDLPLRKAPNFEDIVRIYDRALQRTQGLVDAGARAHTQR